MKILFLELTRERNIEYEVNHLLASHAGTSEISVRIIAQGTAEILRGKRIVEQQNGPLHFYYADFGRDLSIRPRPGKVKRAWMMFSRLLAAVLLIARVIRSFKPDFIYTSQQRYDVLAAQIVRRLTGIPHIMHLYYQVSPNLGRFVFDELKRTPYLVTCSRYNQDKGVLWGLEAKNIALCPNPIEADLFDIPANPRFVREEFGFPAQAPVIVSVGRLDPDKRIDITLRAFKQALQAVPEARLLICGESYLFPNYYLQLQQLVKTLKLEQQVVFGSFCNILPSILAGCDIFCLPSEDDVFSVAIMEAMAAGLPVLSVRHGGTPEIVVEGETGLLSALDDADGLAKNMIRLLKNPDLARRMGNAGKKRIHANFTPEILGPYWLQLMRQFYNAQYYPSSEVAAPGEEPL